MACRGFTPRQAAGDRIVPTQSRFWLLRSEIVVSTFIGPGWLPEQLGSLHKAGSTKMTQTIITTAEIDTSKAKLDIAVHDRTERWQVANARSGWQALAGNLAKVGVTRVGIEATGGYERGVVSICARQVLPCSCSAHPGQGVWPPASAPRQERCARRGLDRGLHGDTRSLEDAARPATGRTGWISDLSRTDRGGHCALQDQARAY